MRAAYFLGGVLTGILGMAAAAWVSRLVNERNCYEQWLREAYAPKKDSPAERVSL